MKRFVYLISPNKIYKNFYFELKKVLAFGNIKYFQLRLKNTSKNKIIQIAKKISIITKKYNVKLIINDDATIAKISKADGCHIGQLDGTIIDAKRYMKMNTFLLFMT